MIHDICKVFGCGKTLSSIEKLCGNKCLKHQNNIQTVNKMTKEIIIQKMYENIDVLLQGAEKQNAAAEQAAQQGETIDLQLEFAEHLTQQAAVLKDYINDIKKLRIHEA